jgi:hypothetical protein
MKLRLAAAALLLAVAGTAAFSEFEEVSGWALSTDGKSALAIQSTMTARGSGLMLTYELKGDYGWAQWNHKLSDILPEGIPLKFTVKAEGTGDFEMKFIDKNGSNFGRKVNIADEFKSEKSVILYKKSLEYWWGGDGNYDGLSEVSFAVSGKGAGTLVLTGIALADAGLAATYPPGGPQLDPDREMKGVGFRQRRADKLIAEDPLVLEWLKQVQDACSLDKQLLPSSMGAPHSAPSRRDPTDFVLPGFYIENQAQTFNNSLTAMAFILKGERERAERILDFYSQATDVDNRCVYLQNFFWKGRPMGFFQYVLLNRENGFPEYHNPVPTERWIGDMAWLLIANKYYEKKFNSDRYKKIIALLRDLLKSQYRDDPGGYGGYVQHWKAYDWRQEAFEPFGHTEGNIDCYAAFRLCGEEKLAAKIKTWLDHIGDRNQPLDCYTWKALALGKEYAQILDIPEYDLRYRKAVTVNGRKVLGFYHKADMSVNNIWLDGTGHIACAYETLGDRKRGYFYANQFDPFIYEMEIKGVKTHALPYTANKEGIYDWVEPDVGLISVAAWYIFAKNGFNPLQLTQAQ